MTGPVFFRKRRQHLLATTTAAITGEKPTDFLQPPLYAVSPSDETTRVQTPLVVGTFVDSVQELN